jgi:CBS domain-containing protein
MRPIAKYMTRQPWSVQIDDSLGVARQMMAQLEVHHLPVLESKKLVGMITDRDLVTAASRVDAPVQEIMTTSALSVDGETPLDEVLERMIERKSDAVVITSRDEVAGIFTANDAVRVLSEVLHGRAGQYAM